MQRLIVNLVPTPQTITTTWSSTPVDVSRMNDYSVQIQFTGASASVRVEVSNDFTINNGASVANWTTISGSVQTATGTGSGMYEVDNSGHHWVRIVVDGSMTLNVANFISKGN